MEMHTNTGKDIIWEAYLKVEAYDGLHLNYAKVEEIEAVREFWSNPCLNPLGLKGSTRRNAKGGKASQKAMMSSKSKLLDCMPILSFKMRKPRPRVRLYG